MDWKYIDLSPWWWNLGLDDDFRVTSNKSPAYIMECNRYESLGQTTVTITGKGDFIRINVGDNPGPKEVFGTFRKVLEFCKELQQKLSDGDKDISTWVNEKFKEFSFDIDGWLKLTVTAPDLITRTVTFEISLEKTSGITLKPLFDERTTHHDYCGKITLEEGMSIQDALDPFIEKIAEDQKTLISWYDSAMDGFTL